MRRVPAVGVRRGTQFAAALLLGAVVPMLGGCLGITAVDAPSGAPSATYTVTVTVDLTEDEFESPPLDVSRVRGTLAVRFPEEWELVSATYTGSVGGRLTYSSAISDYFTSVFDDPEFADPEAEPGSGPAGKPGYTWWAGYSGVHPGASLGPWEVTFVFDQHGATGFSSLDFVSGITDPESPNDSEAYLSAWFGGAAFERPVFTGVPVEDVAPVIAMFDAPISHDPEITNADSPTFSDVPPTTDPYPFDFVEEAADNFLVTGFADGTFRPWEPLTRIQLLRTLVRSREFFLEDPPADYRMPFGDVPDADRSFVAIAHYNGLVNGKDAIHFDPYGLAARGHVAKILYNALENRYEWPEEDGLPTEAAGVRALAGSVRE